MSTKHFFKYSFFLLPFVCFILGYTIANILIGTNTHKTPHLIGLCLQEALKITSKNHVAIKLVAEKECLVTPPGTIMTQKPAPGRLIKSNQAILVTVSKQAATTAAPYLLSKTKAEIDQINKEKNLKIKVYPQLHSLPTQSCIAQIPEVNTPLKNKKMIIYTSKQKQNIYIVPKFIGTELNKAVESLQKHQLNPIITDNQTKLMPPYPQNLIITQQKPHAGSLVEINQNLTIFFEVQEA